MYFYFYKVCLFDKSKGLVVGKIMRLAAGLYHNHVSSVYTPITLDVCHPKTLCSIPSSYVLEFIHLNIYLLNT